MVRVGDEGAAAEAGLEECLVGAEHFQENLAESCNMLCSFISDWLRHSAEKPGSELGLACT